MSHGLTTSADELRWYQGIARYQWLVLLIASLGWIFDVFEGQIFVASMNEAMPSLAAASATDQQIAAYNKWALAAFLAGGALGGMAFGALSDRIGRKRTLSITILFYSAFTCVSALSQQWWHLAALRFMVALGVGGEWAVASAMVAEEFPRRARAHVGSIFHASSVLGTFLAIAAGTYVIGNADVQSWARNLEVPWLPSWIAPATIPWRLGFALGAVPALLIIWIRLSLHEPEEWVQSRAQEKDKDAGAASRIGELLGAQFRSRTAIGVTLAAVGLATFWGVHIYGKNLLVRELQRAWNAGIPDDELIAARSRALATVLKNNATYPAAAVDEALQSWESRLGGGPYAERLSRERLAAAPGAERAAGEALRAELDARVKREEMLGMFLVTAGGGVGLLAFGPISQRVGRRRAFAGFFAAGFVASIVCFRAITGIAAMRFALPVFGFLTLAMHAGYAIYFPELYPTRLRGAGAGFCFNAGRLIAAPVLVCQGWFQQRTGLDTLESATVLSGLFLLGAVVSLAAPETRDADLPD